LRIHSSSTNRDIHALHTLFPRPAGRDPASAEQLTLDRIHAILAGGPGVRSLKVSPDGARVTFLRGRDDNQFQLDLWEYNLKDKSTHRLVDSKILVPKPVGRESAPRARAHARSRASSTTAGRRTASAAGADRRQPVPDRCQQAGPARLVARAMCSIRKFRRKAATCRSCATRTCS
jgi:hypothetical protein